LLVGAIVDMQGICCDVQKQTCWIVTTTIPHEISNEGKPIKVIQSDKGGEVLLGVFNRIYEMHGIWQQFTITNTPHQNNLS
jgi:hypothetical protein